MIVLISANFGNVFLASSCCWHKQRMQEEHKIMGLKAGKKVTKIAKHFASA